MQLPFTRDEFFAVFAHYNEAVWPVQMLIMFAALAALVAAAVGTARGSRLAGGLLAALWIWMGAVYHLAFFSRINPAAALFGALFLLQGALLLRAGVMRGALSFRAGRDARTLLGLILLAYALVGYPVLGHALGQRYPAEPTFGLPCPTTIYTFALLLWVRPRVPVSLVVIPLFWAAVATAAALRLDVPQDLGLPAAAGVMLVAMVAAGWPRAHSAGGRSLEPHARQAHPARVAHR